MRTLLRLSLVASLIFMPTAVTAAEQNPTSDDADVCLKTNKDEQARSSGRAERELAAAECARRLKKRRRGMVVAPPTPSPTNPNEPMEAQEKKAGDQKPTGCVLRPDQPGNCGASGGR